VRLWHRPNPTEERQREAIWPAPMQPRRELYLDAFGWPFPGRLLSLTADVRGRRLRVK